MNVKNEYRYVCESHLDVPATPPIPLGVAEGLYDLFKDRHQSRIEVREVVVGDWEVVTGEEA